MHSKARPAPWVGWIRRGSGGYGGLGAIALTLACQTNPAPSASVPPSDGANAAASDTAATRPKAEADEPREGEGWLDSATAQAEAARGGGQ